ncbi:hypothetical protein PV02_03345 [Methanolobus chelungpuianus]|uniref:Methyl-accepting chemotaxis protein n=1 Tax=Methanolobus chelungpuianus TaxID=502115 RepID=A0AAE3KYK0_9EURY|nr:hypothetical protein [Methanolobus chelungpuianus]
MDEASAISERSATDAQEAFVFFQEQTASMQELSTSVQDLTHVADSMQAVFLPRGGAHSLVCLF